MACVALLHIHVHACIWMIKTHIHYQSGVQDAFFLKCQLVGKKKADCKSDITSSVFYKKIAFLYENNSTPRALVWGHGSLSDGVQKGLWRHDRGPRIPDLQVVRERAEKGLRKDPHNATPTDSWSSRTMEPFISEWTAALHGQSHFYSLPTA